MQRSLKAQRDSVKGVAVYGFNSTDIDGTTAREILAAPGAGYKYLIRRIRIVNKTNAQTAVITVQDDAGTPVVLYTGVAHDPATAVPVDDSGWLDAAIETDENVAVDGVAATATGDTIVHVWAEKVAA